MAVSKSETRADKLFVAFTTVKDWSAGGTKPREVWGFDAANKDIAGLTRRTKTVATEIDKILAEFGVDRFDVLASEDKQALVAARTVMRQLGADVEHAKERVKRHFAVKKEEDKKQEEYARKAIERTFPQVDIEETVMLLAALGKTFLLKDLRSAVFGSHGRDVHDLVGRAQREVTDGLVRKLRDAMRGEASASAATSDMRCKYDNGRPALLEKHGELIRQVKAALVQWEFERRNRANA